MGRRLTTWVLLRSFLLWLSFLLSLPLFLPLAIGDTSGEATGPVAPVVPLQVVVEPVVAEEGAGNAETKVAELVERTIDLALASSAYSDPPMPAAERDARQAALDADIRALDTAAIPSYLEGLRLGGARSRVVRIARGALLTEDFGHGLDAARWPSAFPKIDGVTVEVTEGELRIHGQPEFAPGRVGAPYTGIVSEVFTDRSVVLRVRVRVAALEAAPSRAAAIAHLCGSVPDYFVECLLGRHDGEGPDWALSGHGGDESGPPPARLPADPPDSWYEVELLYHPLVGLATARVRTEGRWAPFPAPARAYLSSTKVELKAILDPGTGAIDFRFDDCRLFPDPAERPITLQLVSSLFSGHPVSEATVAVQYVVSGAPHAITVVSDENGRCEVFLPREADFPARLLLRVQAAGQLASELAIDPKSDLDGAYPGDVWMVCPGFPFLAR